MNQLGVDIRKIIGLDDEIAELKKMVSSAPIKGRVGQAYTNGFSRGNASGNGNGGKDGPDSTDNSESSQEDKDNGNDTSKKADEEINTGDDMGMGIGGLFDCESGQCINVNFNQDYKRKPKGWEEQCKPPKAVPSTTYYAVYKEFYEHGFDSKVTSSSWSYHATAEDAVSAINNVGGLVGAVDSLCSGNSNNCQKTQNYTFNKGNVSQLQELGQTNASGTVSLDFGLCTFNASGCSYATGRLYSGVAYRRQCSPNGGNPSGVCENAKPDRWPDSKCSEIQTNATGTNFEMACKKYDKNMPKRFTDGSFSEMELCDKDGNKVKIKRTVKGFEITQDKYGTTAIVDPSSYKVTETHKWRR